MRLKSGFLGVMVIIMALIVGQAVLASQAEQSTQDTIELIGAVQTINADGSIVVNGVTVTITTAELNVTLTVGQVVKVEGTLLPDGRVAAREVQAPQDNDIRDEDEIELVGVVESFDGTTLVVSGLVIDLSGVEINDPIVVGQIIKVHGSFDANGNLIARETDNNMDDDGSIPSPASTPQVVPPPASTPEVTPGGNNDTSGEFEIVGTLQQVGDGFIVVNGQTISIIGAEIKNQLVVGALVKLHLSNQNGQLVAREVENARDDDDDDNANNNNRPGEFEIVGTLQQVGDGFIVVNGQTISIIGAEIKNQLVVGALVKLHLSNQNGQLVAREVENARDDDDEDDNSGRGSDDDRWDEVYTVRPGDTLSSIAARAGVSVEELARINNITNTSVVVAGTRLIVPDSFDDDDGGNSGRGSGSSDDNDDNSGSGSSNSGSGNNNSDDDDDDGSSNSGRGSGSSDDSDDDDGGSSGSGSGDDDD